MKWKRVYVEITNQCNLHCDFCIHNQREPRFMSVAEFAHVMQEERPYCEYVYLHVLGEPLMHPHLEALLKICKEQQMQVMLTTNGTLLAKRLTLLQKYPPRQISISLHSFPHQEAALAYLQEVMQAADVLAKTSYISYRFWNLREQQMDRASYQMWEVLAKHYHLDPTDYGKRRIVLGKQIFLSLEEQFTWPSLQAPFVSAKGRCLGGEMMIAVLCDGSVVPCCLDSNGDISFGNLFESRLTDLLASDRYRQMMEAKQRQELTEALCKRCAYRTRFEKGA